MFMYRIELESDGISYEDVNTRIQYSKRITKDQFNELVEKLFEVKPIEVSG